MSVGRMGLNPRPFCSLPNTTTFASYIASSVSTATNTTYGSYVELVSAASNTTDKYIVAISVHFTGTAISTYGPMYLKLAIGAAGAETAIATDMDASSTLVFNNTGNAYYHGIIHFVPALHISAATRIAVAVRQNGGSGSTHTALVVCHYAIRTAIAQ